MSDAFDRGSRLLKKADFGIVFNSGSRNHGRYFLVVYCNVKPGRARLGIAVSRKVSKKAVVRNRIKRQIRESFRLNKKLLMGVDCVVVAKNAAASTEQSELRSSLDSHWRNISENA